MPRFPYDFFEEYVVRTPLFSYKNFRQALSAEEISDAAVKDICSDPVFQEAIYLASPNLYDEINQWKQSEKKLSSGQSQKLKNTIIKYYTRMSTRCTPFGLFSGVGLGIFDTKTEKEKANNKRLLRDTKLDMHLLVSLSKTFERNPVFRTKLLYFPNNSIYKLGKRIRYVEYEYNKGKRDYIISSAPLSEELSQILIFSEHGKTISQMAEILMNSEINENEATEFIEELIEHQVLVSEIEPNVSGNDFLDLIITVLTRIEATAEIETLVSIRQKLNQLDLKVGNHVSLYTEIEELIKSFKTEYEQKHLFQTDLYFNDYLNISPRWKKDIKKAIVFLSKITALNKDTPIEHFKKAFYRRFETEEMPLTYVLDTEVGIGYLQNQTAKGLHPYLEDLEFSYSGKKQNFQIQLTPFQKLLNEKLQEALSENQFTVRLSDYDVRDFEENLNDLPDTFSVITEIVLEKGQEKLSFKSIGGSSAANLLGRFCSEKSDVQNLAKQITKTETELYPDDISAEIIHLPEARIGNILRRPTLRNYEIPYLAQSVLPKENQISVDDLLISVKNNRIILRSGKHDKLVRPYLTNAHNYHTNALPVYHFLSDLHSQDTLTGLYFNWGGLKRIYKFLPRIEYEDIILSKAQWNLTEKDIELLAATVNDKDRFLNAVKIWRKKKQIPQWIQWAKSDNTLPLNLENYDMAKMLIQIIKSEHSITIEEFLYNENDDFRREFIFPMFKI